MNRRIIAVVEGQTEQTFIRDVLAPWLGGRGHFLTAQLVGRPGHKGGIGPYERGERNILNLLKQEFSTIITTMFDLYGMPLTWPGREDAAVKPHEQKAAIVEDAIQNDFLGELKLENVASRFVPYVQMYEYEALIFSDPAAIAGVLQEPKIAGALTAIRAAVATSEEINDSAMTAPSKRLSSLHPAYEKVLHGTITAQRIGIDTIMSQCPHFREWLARLQECARRQQP